MNTQDGDHHDAAVDALAAREYERAGDRYTRGGRRVLADPREDLDPFAPDEKGWIGQGLQHLLGATVAYRVAGVDGRATQRAVEAFGATVHRDPQRIEIEGLGGIDNAVVPEPGGVGSSGAFRRGV